MKSTNVPDNSLDVNHRASDKAERLSQRQIRSRINSIHSVALGIDRWFKSLESAADRKFTLALVSALFTSLKDARQYLRKADIEAACNGSAIVPVFCSRLVEPFNSLDDEDWPQAGEVSEPSVGRQQEQDRSAD